MRETVTAIIAASIKAIHSLIDQLHNIYLLKRDLNYLQIAVCFRFHKSQQTPQQKPSRETRFESIARHE